MPEIIDTVETAFREKGRGNVEMPPKPGIHTRPDAFIHAMPAYIKTTGAAGMKWIAGYPENTERGLPYISGLLILNDPDTGFPLAVMDAAWITAMRTAAATAVAAKYMCRPEAKSLAVLGCGVQGRSNADALVAVLKGLDQIYAYDIRPSVVDLFCREQRAKHNLRCTICASPEEAVRAAEVIVTAGPILRHPSPVIVLEWIRPGSFVCTLDFDSYVTAQVFQAADLFATDDVDQLRYYQKSGYFTGVPSDAVDLGKVVAAGSSIRKKASDVVIAANLGLALEDVAVGHEVLRRARAKQAGTILPL
jgi:ornithine cyclodeaminase/alanine dehydrogenase